VEWLHYVSLFEIVELGLDHINYIVNLILDKDVDVLLWVELFLILKHVDAKRCVRPINHRHSAYTVVQRLLTAGSSTQLCIRASTVLELVHRQCCLVLDPVLSQGLHPIVGSERVVPRLTARDVVRVDILGS